MTKQSIAAIESLLNQHIQKSSTAQDRLFALAGRSLAINIRNFDIKLQLDAEQTRLEVSMISDDSIVATTATISGTPLTLLSLLNVSTLADFRAAGVEFSGDIQTAEAFAELLRFARPDLEEELSHLVGDIVAHKMARSVRRVKGWGTRAIDALTMDTSEFLQEEIRQLPPRVEVESFSREVERLREDTDRTVQRVDKFLKDTNGRATWDGSD
ncbi:MAG: SCP2 sterol-binding domain-containing protein [Pseudomonadota bacterium]|jgi:ubiquinone biosynthesis protein UbiJ|nr:SCP2 sterol-binding domain-containing protein [Pseudomonadota bacterium]